MTASVNLQPSSRLWDREEEEKREEEEEEGRSETSTTGWLGGGEIKMNL